MQQSRKGRQIFFKLIKCENKCLISLSLTALIVICSFHQLYHHLRGMTIKFSTRNLEYQADIAPTREIQSQLLFTLLIHTSQYSKQLEVGTAKLIIRAKKQVTNKIMAKSKCIRTICRSTLSIIIKHNIIKSMLLNCRWHQVIIKLGPKITHKAKFMYLSKSIRALMSKLSQLILKKPNFSKRTALGQ